MRWPASERKQPIAQFGLLEQHEDHQNQHQTRGRERPQGQRQLPEHRGALHHHLHGLLRLPGGFVGLLQVIHDLLGRGLDRLDD